MRYYFGHSDSNKKTKEDYRLFLNKNGVLTMLNCHTMATRTISLEMAKERSFDELMQRILKGTFRSDGIRQNPVDSELSVTVTEDAGKVLATHANANRHRYMLNTAFRGHDIAVSFGN